MSPEDWRRVSGIFHAALAAPTERQTAFLDESCRGEPALRAEVERLLTAHRNAGAFGDAPIYPKSMGSALLRRADHGATGSAEPRQAETHTPTRRNWVVLAVLAALVAAVGLAFAHAAGLLIARAGEMPRFGWTPAARGTEWYVSDLEAASPAAALLRAGDRVVSLDSVPAVVGEGPYLMMSGLRPGQSYELTIERDTSRLTVRLPVETTSNSNELLYFVVSLVWCVVGLFIGWARPDTVLARLACATSIAVGLLFLQVGVIKNGPLWQPLHAVLGFHFLARFPTGEPTRGGWRMLLAFAYACGAYAAVLGLTQHALFLTNGAAATAQFLNDHEALWRLRWPAALTGFGTAVLGMVLVTVRNYRRLRDDDHRRRIRWVMFAALLGLLPQFWWSFVSIFEQLTGPSRLSRLDLLANAGTVTIPLAMTYAVVKHRVLDIKVFIRRGVRYLLARRALQIAVAVPFGALLAIAARNRDSTLTEIIFDTRAYLFWLVAAGVVLRFRRPIEQWLDRRFFREEYDREKLMAKLLDDSRRAESLADLSSLVSEMLVGAMHPHTVCVWYRDPSERVATAAGSAASTPPNFPADERWLSWLERQPLATAVSIGPDTDLSPPDAQWLEQRGIDVVVPMADSDDHLIGALLLGAKKSEEPYTAGDSRFLDSVAKQTAMIRDNLRLRARLNEEVRVRHDVLARLDERLPDLLKECPVCGACYSGSTERCTMHDVPLVLTLPISRTIDDRYRLDRLIGKGGMGAVYEAADLRLVRTVAIKIMLSRGFGRPGILRRFRREARAAAALNHPNVVAVFDAGSLEGEVAYIVMERVAGETLRAVLDRERVLAPPVVGEWFAPLLSGLAAAHARGIVHRDLKPDNVMGHRVASGRLDVKLLDLGLAKLRTPDKHGSVSLTQDGAVMGTPDYMSPEQLLGRDVDQRADLFAIGVMLTEALVGRDKTLSRTHAEAPLAERLAESSWPNTALRELLRRCLAVDPNDRPPTAIALRLALIPLLR